MINSFNDFIKKESLCNKKNKILLAISGGIDSVVLLDLFIKSKYKVYIAHCNFQLRNEDSDEDENFVKRLGESYNIPCYTKKFNTIAHAKLHKQSIEMAARELRYNWFNALLESKEIDYIATGHHINDSIETFFLNLSRGTGINGLTGIPAKNKKTIRPLLFATREQINKYAKDNQLSFRYDQSNDSTKYMRNIIRKQVIPIMKKINPSFDQVMERNLNHIKDAYNLFDNTIDVIQKDIVRKNESQHYIDIKKLKARQNRSIILFEIIKVFGFNTDQVLSIIKSIDEQSGKIFYTTTHQLLIDRNFLIIEPISSTSTTKLQFNNIDELLNAPIFHTAEVIDNSEFKINRKKNFACLDLDKLTFPIKIRKWKTGEVFYPLGMKQQKKLSDFFIDNKLNRFDKNKVLIMLSDNNIVWVMGIRIDNRYKVTQKTKTTLLLEV